MSIRLQMDLTVRFGGPILVFSGVGASLPYLLLGLAFSLSHLKAPCLLFCLFLCTAQASSPGSPLCLHLLQEHASLPGRVLEVSCFQGRSPWHPMIFMEQDCRLPFNISCQCPCDTTADPKADNIDRDGYPQTSQRSCQKNQGSPDTSDSADSDHSILVADVSPDISSPSTLRPS